MNNREVIELTVGPGKLAVAALVAAIVFGASNGLSSVLVIFSVSMTFVWVSENMVVYRLRHRSIKLAQLLLSYLTSMLIIGAAAVLLQWQFNNWMIIGLFIHVLSGIETIYRFQTGRDLFSLELRIRGRS